MNQKLSKVISFILSLVAVCMPREASAGSGELNFNPASVVGWNLQLMEGATDKPLVAAYRDKKYDALFTRDRGWNGGDGVLTVGLPDGNVLWVFNDSFYGVVGENRARGNCNFPRNSLMVQKVQNGFLGETEQDLVWLADYVQWTDPAANNYFKARTHLRHPQAGKTDEEIANGDIDNDYLYWAGDGVVSPDGKSVQFYWNGVSNDMGAAGGTVVATYSLEGNMPTGYYLEDIPDYLPHEGDYMYMTGVSEPLSTNPWSFGNTICEGLDGHIYLYHSIDNYHTVVARTKTMDLNSPLEYRIKDVFGFWWWHDASVPTAEDLRRSSIIWDDELVNMPWVFKDGDWYYLVGQGPYFSRDINIWRSETPYGPFNVSTKRKLFTLPDKLDKLGDQSYGWLYMVNLHPALSRQGELVFSTNTDCPESAGGFFGNFNAEGSADFYRPYFYRVYNWKALWDEPDNTETLSIYVSENNVDEPETNRASYEKPSTLYLDRKLNVNEWNAIVLPNDLSGAQLKTAFQADGTTMQLAVLLGTKENDPNTVVFRPVNLDEEGLKAGECYLIKPTKAAQELPADTISYIRKRIDDNEFYTGEKRVEGSFYVINGVTRSRAVAEAVPADNVVRKSYGKVDAASYYLKPQNDGDEVPFPANSYFIDNGEVKHFEQDWGGLKATMWYLTPSDSNAQLSFVIESEDGAATHIGGVAADRLEAEGKVYGVDGRQVRKSSRPGKDAHGVYIVKGKKFVGQNR